MIPPAFFFFFLKIALSLWGSSENFMIFCFNSVKNVMGVLMEMALNL